ncbi:MAG: hypothetical protein QXL51_04455 [Candidatus Aenigmatarchaeota archaeon]
MTTIKKSDMKKINKLRSNNPFETFSIKTFSVRTPKELINNGEKFFHYLIGEFNKYLFYNDSEILKKLEKNKDYNDLTKFVVTTGIGALSMYSKNKITTKEFNNHLQTIENIYTTAVQAIINDIKNEEIYNHLQKEKYYTSYIR